MMRRLSRTRTRDLEPTRVEPFDQDAGVEAIARLGWRERRRRLRLARRGGRYLFRGRFVPRTLRAFAFTAVISGLLVGALGAAGYSIYSRDLAQAREDGQGQVAAPAARDRVVGGGNQARAAHGQIRLGSQGRAATAVAVADDGENRFYVTAYDPVAPSVFADGPAIMAGETTLAMWRWDQRHGLAVVAGPSTGEPVRRFDDLWRGGPGDVVYVVDTTSGDVVELPGTVVEVDSRTVMLGADTSALEVGSAVVDAAGTVVGVVVGVGPGVVRVTRASTLCSTVLSCSS